ncbi:MAG: hypothetical protein IT370_22895 [Deltaproteobacteria bacterium]|nr:hypothetical protein [Deltaproteobacteria bacterium]
MRTPILVLLCLSIAACTSETPETPDLAEVASQSAASTATSVTIRGNVFYNDRRNDGLFSTRRTQTDQPGERCSVAGQRDDGSACSSNLLGLYYGVVDVIERDEGYFAPTAWDCKQEDLIKSVPIASDGSFTATFSHTDACDSDSRPQVAIALKVRLRYCGADWGCFSVNTSVNDPYFVWYPGATSSAPLSVTSMQQVTLPDMVFKEPGSSNTTVNDTSKAVNYYASVVDTILTIHRDGGVPFYKDEFGEIQYVYPSNNTETATTKSATKVVIRGDWDPSWPDGHTPAHEYGHVLMLRAWDGDYGFVGVGHSCNDTEQCESQQIAFKEAWAQFTARAVFDATEGCGRSGFDDNASKPLTGELGMGTHFRRNVEKALCDWYDTRVDDDAALDGNGDHFNADDFYSMWVNLRHMYTRRADYGGDYENPGLYFCDWVDYYLDVRKSASAVGAASHDNYVFQITNLIYNNNIACFRPAP